VATGHGHLFIYLGVQRHPHMWLFRRGDNEVMKRQITMVRKRKGWGWLEERDTELRVHCCHRRCANQQPHKRIKENTGALTNEKYKQTKYDI
jgi:hypothetical protein